MTTDMRAAEASIVLPLRDGGPWFREALDSILAQTFEAWELIVVDDGSRDQSPALARSAAVDDPRIKVLPSRGRGIVDALNTGLAAAKGPLLVRMDADDISHPERLSRQIAALQADPSLFAVSCVVEGFPAANLTDGMRRYLDWQNSLLSPEAIARERFVESPVVHPSLILRTEVLREVLGGWKNPDWAEDWDLVLRSCEAGLKIGRVPESLFRWRLHAAQLTRTDSRCSPEAFERARAHYLVRHLRRNEESARPVVILGAGPIGKSLARALLKEGLRITAFADVAKGKIGNTVASGDGSRWPVLDSEGLLALRPCPFALAAVGSPGGRERVRAACQSWGWSEEVDFLVVA